MMVDNIDDGYVGDDSDDGEVVDEDVDEDDDEDDTVISDT